MGMTPAQASAPGPGPRQPGARAAIAWFAVALAGSALLGLLATRVVPPVPPHQVAPQPERHHLFGHHAGGIP